MKRLKLDHFPDCLRWLVWRGAAASFDALVADLAAQAQPGQLVARLKTGLELPLPQTLPPAQIGMARRIDATADICSLGKRFKNCLANFVTQVDAGACAIYLWGDPTAPAVCRVTRHGRLAGSLSEALVRQMRSLTEINSKKSSSRLPMPRSRNIPLFVLLECILQAD